MDPPASHTAPREESGSGVRDTDPLGRLTCCSFYPYRSQDRLAPRPRGTRPSLPPVLGYGTDPVDRQGRGGPGRAARGVVPPPGDRSDVGHVAPNLNPSAH